jgi:hypothetical protein
VAPAWCDAAAGMSFATEDMRSKSSSDDISESSSRGDDGVFDTTLIRDASLSLHFESGN